LQGVASGLEARRQLRNPCLHFGVFWGKFWERNTPKNVKKNKGPVQTPGFFHFLIQMAAKQ
jgi:hypothetical protein